MLQIGGKAGRDRTSLRAGSALTPGQTVMTPAAKTATMGVRIGVTFKAFQNVVGHKTQFSGALCCGNRAHAAATQKNNFLAGRNGSAQAIVEAGIHGHARPLLPGQGNRIGYEADPFALGIGSYINQYGLAGFPPFVGELGRNVASVALRCTHCQQGTTACVMAQA